MNWYKIAKSYPKTLSPVVFLRRLREYGVEKEREAAGSSKILINRRNNRRTNFHTHRGQDVSPGSIKGILRDLGIDYWEFLSGKPTIKQPVFIEPKKENRDWQESEWYKKQLQQQDQKEYELV